MGLHQISGASCPNADSDSDVAQGSAFLTNSQGMFMLLAHRLYLVEED